MFENNLVWWCLVEKSACLLFVLFRLWLWRLTAHGSPVGS